MQTIVFLAFLCASTGADARVIQTKSCVMTVGSFCPVETAGAILFAACLFAGAGFPIRWAIRRHTRSKMVRDPGYEPSAWTRFVYRNAGFLVLGAAGTLLVAHFLPS